MTKTILLFGAALLASLFSACSSSNETPQGFILGYSKDPFTSSENSRAFEVFPLKVVNDGVGVKGATVHYTAYFTSSTKTDTIPRLSDANGEYNNPALPLDSMSGVTFYATKDSMKSNTLVWHR